MRFSSSIGTLTIGMAFFACQPRVVVGNLGDAGDGPESQSGAGTGGAGTGGAGSGGSTAHSGSGGSTANPEACADDLKHVLPASGVDCPEEVASADTPCDVAEGTTCTWQLTGPNASGFEVMGCFQHAGAKAWFGSSVNVGNSGGIHNELCPHTPVAANSGCEDHAGQYCQYAEETCLCDATTATWTCQPGFGKLVVDTTDRVERLCVPFDETRLVKDLTSTEARAWCTWSLDPLGQGGNLGLLAPTSPPYDLESYGTLYGDVGKDVCMVQLPVDACTANLTVAPDCDATLGELDECVETLRSRNRVGLGCEALLGNPNCAGVMVLRVPNGAPCALPLP